MVRNKFKDIQPRYFTKPRLGKKRREGTGGVEAKSVDLVLLAVQEILQNVPPKM